MTFADRIKTLCAAANLSFNRLATQGMSSREVYNILNERRQPSLAFLLHAADRLGYSALYLWTGDSKGYCPFCERGKH